MYDRDDVQTLSERFLDCVEQRKNRKENSFNASVSMQNAKMNNRKLSRDEEMRKRKL